MHEVALHSEYDQYLKYLKSETDGLPEEVNIPPLREDYANVPLEDAYDLKVLFDYLHQTQGVQYGEKTGAAFRSEKRKDADDEQIGGTDTPAHQEARLAPGYIYYVKGPIIVADRCMSFCFWETPEDAQRASLAPAHRQAVNMAPIFYKSAVLERLAVDYHPGGVDVRVLSAQTMIFD